MPNFIENLNDTIVGGDLNRSVTENGALGYKTTGRKLVDLNYMLSSMRNLEEKEIWSRFLDAYAENPTLAILWLFFARDIRGGLLVA